LLLHQLMCSCKMEGVSADKRLSAAMKGEGMSADKRLSAAMKGEGMSNRLESAATRSAETGQPIGESQSFGIMPRTLISTHPLAYGQ
jgi:hypothetical protein